MGTGFPSTYPRSRTPWRKAPPKAASEFGRTVVQRLDPVHAWQLDIHEDDGGRRHLGQPDPLLRVVGLDRPVAVELEDVALQLAVLLVVLDDEDQLARHQRKGNVKVKVDPRPSSLSTQI